jgi:hypothetical protein
VEIRRIETARQSNGRQSISPAATGPPAGDEQRHVMTSPAEGGTELVDVPLTSTSNLGPTVGMGERQTHRGFLAV